MSTIARLIRDIYGRHRDDQSGALADYIPELTKANPEWFGISLVTTDGHSYSVGDCRQEFTIQSVSKPFCYGLALDLQGLDHVLGKVSVEPSGEAFNELSIEHGTGRPFNPMINAGAIATTSLIPGSGIDERFEQLRQCFSVYAGRELSVDEAVYRSESATGDRNRMIARTLCDSGIMKKEEMDDALEAYFRQCSVLLNCDDLATMGATLANGGVNPVTQQKAIDPQNLDKVLSIMATCGMYNGSGEWIYRVGFPAKSGVGGGIVGVLPGQIGLAVFSPLLDARGNSVRGLKVFAELSKIFGLHLFNLPTINEEAVRSVYHLSGFEPERQRPKEDREIIRVHGDSVVIIEMQGDLFFSSLERALRAAQFEHTLAQTIVLDLSRVGTIDTICPDILRESVHELSVTCRQLVIVDPARRFDAQLFAGSIAIFGSIHTALSEAERALVSKHTSRENSVPALIPFQDFELFQGLESAELDMIEGLLEMQSYRPEETIVVQGDESDFLYLLAHGSVGIYITADGKRSRIQTLVAGVSFGDQALIDHRKRSADVVAETKVTCYQMSVENFEALETKAPATFARILRNLFRLNLEILRSTSRELAIARKGAV